MKAHWGCELWASSRDLKISAVTKDESLLKSSLTPPRNSFLYYLLSLASSKQHKIDGRCNLLLSRQWWWASERNDDIRKSFEALSCEHPTGNEECLINSRTLTRRGETFNDSYNSTSSHKMLLSVAILRLSLSLPVFVSILMMQSSDFK